MAPKSLPLLLLDVDGVISLFGFDPAAPPPGRWQLVDGIAHLLSGTAGRHIGELAETYDVVWCTGWEDRANDYLPLALELPGPFPYLTFGAASEGSVRHWKLDAIEAYAGPHRPLAWVDDAHDPGCHEWAESRPGPTLLILTDPAIGLTQAHVAQLMAWAGGVSVAPGPLAGGDERERSGDRAQVTETE